MIDASVPSPARLRHVMLAAGIGSALEWYDFFIYGLASALVFGPLFFPTYDPTVGVLASFATFAVGFLARPFGGLFFGHFGDRWGRKPMLVATLLLVGGSTFLIGLLPTYSQVGIWAPIMLLGLRLLQGFGAGAEYGGAVVMAVEFAPDGKRGLYGAFAPMGTQVGIWAPVMLLGMRLLQGFGAGAEYGGAVVMAVEFAPDGKRGLYGAFAPMGTQVGNALAAGTFWLVGTMAKDDMLAWGWRIPFLVSLLLLALGVYIRAEVSETPVFQEACARHPPLKLPALEAVRRSPRNFLVVVGARLAENALGYLYPVFGLSYLMNTLQVPRNVAISGVIFGSFALAGGLLFFAWLSDRIGRRPVYIFGALFSAAFAFPFFLLAETRDPLLIVIAFVVEMGIGSAAMFGPQAVYFAELFGPRLRYSGFAFARELGSIIAGGPAPLIAALLVAWMGGQPWGVCLYVIVLSLITAFAVWCGPETYKSDIRADDVEDCQPTVGIPPLLLRPTL